MIAIYFVLVYIMQKVVKRFQNSLLRQAHFVLAVVCRAENNRYYLKRGVEVRPGYLARWIEFICLEIDKESESGAQALEIIQKRHAFDSKETQKLIEIDHQKKLDGVNRDFN